MRRSLVLWARHWLETAYGAFIPAAARGRIPHWEHSIVAKRRKYRFPDRASAEAAERRQDELAFAWSVFAQALMTDRKSIVTERAKGFAYTVRGVPRVNCGCHILVLSFHPPGQSAYSSIVTDPYELRQVAIRSGSAESHAISAAVDAVWARCETRGVLAA